MLIDARTLPENQVIETEVCIIGAGAAGITMAREFMGKEFRVCLLESGGLEFDEDTQSLSKGENIGLPYYPLEETCLRYFGGTTNSWDGWCRPFDEIDFEARNWIPYSGWPLCKSSLDPFYERAQSIFQIGPFSYDVESWEDSKEKPRLPLAKSRVLTTIFQMSPPTRFGKVYRNDIMSANNISTYLHANVVEIETSNTAQAVTRVRVATLEGSIFWVSARLFILATGGIENPRILLLSNKVHSGGLGNQHGLVGRFYMEHPCLLSSVCHLIDPPTQVGLYDRHIVNGVKIVGALTLAEKVLRQEKLPNVVFFLRPSSSQLEHLAASKGVVSTKHILRSIRQGIVPEDLLKHLGNVVADINNVGLRAYRYLFNPAFPIDMIRVFIRFEQIPRPDSRVTLAEERDCLGNNLVRLDWRLSAEDKRNIRRATEILRQELERAGVGRLQVQLGEEDDTWPPFLGGGRHHMGTTRMDADPKKGVVDEHCRVHGISNLFVAGSSVFPTGGYANPILTIVALALRLADHVKKLMT